MDKTKANKMKKKIRKLQGVKQMYWDHTKNYLEEMKHKEDKLVKERTKHHSIKSFIGHYIKKECYYTLINKIVKKLLKKEQSQLDFSTRKQVFLSLKYHLDVALF